MRIVLKKGIPVGGAARAAFGNRRITTARRRIMEAAMRFSGAFSVEELAEVTRESDPSVGSIATVYRTVAAMEETGFIERVGTRRGQALYARCGLLPHHHHVICEGCGRIAEAACPVDTRSAADTGFVITRHEVALYGLCPACAIEGLRS